MFSGSWPITSSRYLQKRVRSKGPSLHRHCPISDGTMPLSDSRPAQNLLFLLRATYPASGTGLPRYPSSLIRHAVPNTPVDQDRWVGYVPVLLRPSPNIGRVGIHNFPFGACSGFTRVTACRIAAALSAYICSPGLQQDLVSHSHCLGSYRDEPTISRAELSSAGNLRPRGAPISLGIVKICLSHIKQISLLSISSLLQGLFKGVHYR